MLIFLFIYIRPISMLLFSRSAFKMEQIRRWFLDVFTFYRERNRRLIRTQRCILKLYLWEAITGSWLMWTLTPLVYGWLTTFLYLTEDVIRVCSLLTFYPVIPLHCVNRGNINYNLPLDIAKYIILAFFLFMISIINHKTKEEGEWETEWRRDEKRVRERMRKCERDTHTDTDRNTEERENEINRKRERDGQTDRRTHAHTGEREA